MQNEKKRSTGLRLKRLLYDEWAMLALLGAAAVQTGFALHAMNGVVRSNHQVLESPQPAQALASQPTSVPATSVKESLAVTSGKQVAPKVAD